MGTDLSQLAVAVSLCPVFVFGNSDGGDGTEEQNEWKRVVFGYRKLDEREVAQMLGRPANEKYVGALNCFLSDRRHKTRIYRVFQVNLDNIWQSIALSQV